MKRPIVCIFAHPDDESFGPGGTIAKLARTRDVYLICATKGEAGKNRGKDGRGIMAGIREKELLRAAKILGIKKVFFLGFEDGTLCNNTYHCLAAKIEKILLRLKPDTILTNEPRGVSGHIDHITVSMVSNYVFDQLSFVKKIMMFCISRERASASKGYFIYVPPGYDDSDIDLTVDVQDVWDTKTEAIMAHESQIEDIKRILARAGQFPKKEFFLMRKK